MGGVFRLHSGGDCIDFGGRLRERRAIGETAEDRVAVADLVDTLGRAHAHWQPQLVVSR